eukprot:Colp12_sorted_trinity150504_noHs@23936
MVKVHPYTLSTAQFAVSAPLSDSDGFTTPEGAAIQVEPLKEQTSDNDVHTLPSAYGQSYLSTSSLDQLDQTRFKRIRRAFFYYNLLPVIIYTAMIGTQYLLNVHLRLSRQCWRETFNGIQLCPCTTTELIITNLLSGLPSLLLLLLSLFFCAGRSAPKLTDHSARRTGLLCATGALAIFFASVCDLAMYAGVLSGYLNVPCVLTIIAVSVLTLMRLWLPSWKDAWSLSWQFFVVMSVSLATALMVGYAYDPLVRLTGVRNALVLFPLIFTCAEAVVMLMLKRRQSRFDTARNSLHQVALSIALACIDCFRFGGYVALASTEGYGSMLVSVSIGVCVELAGRMALPHRLALFILRKTGLRQGDEEPFKVHVLDLQVAKQRMFISVIAFTPLATAAAWRSYERAPIAFKHPAPCDFSIPYETAGLWPPPAVAFVIVLVSLGLIEALYWLYMRTKFHTNDEPLKCIKVGLSV